MKLTKHLAILLFAAYCGQSNVAQTPHLDAVRLTSGGQVVNTVIFNNHMLTPLSAGVQIKFSAVDTVMEGEGNIQLSQSPFTAGGWSIDHHSTLYNAGTTQGLESTDTLDLSNNPRIRCAETDIGAYEFQGAPLLLAFLLEDRRVCEGELIMFSVETEQQNLTFQWYRNGEILEDETSETLAFEASADDAGDYMVVVTGVCGHTASELARVDVERKPLFYTLPDSTINRGDILELFAYPQATQWTELASGNILTSLTVSPWETTAYVAEWHTAVCGIFYDTVHVSVEVDEFLIFVAFSDACNNGEAEAWVETFGTTGPFAYSWMYAGQEISTERTVSGLYPGDYLVSVADTNGFARHHILTIPPANTIQVSYTLTNPNTSGCGDGHIEVAVTGGVPIPEVGYDYQWSEGTVGVPALHYVDAGWYELTVTDFRGCKVDLEIPLQCLYRHVMPTMFISPNEDGMNDYLYIKDIEHYPSNHVLIVDSRGNEVIILERYDNHTIRWDGRNKQGKPMPDGTYYYIVEADGVGAMAGWVLVKDSR